MKYAYMRVSSVEQDYARQIHEFEAAHLEFDRVFKEKISGKSANNRPQLQDMLATVQDGDAVYVTELSRLGRSMRDLSNIAEELMTKNVELHSLKENFDITSATGKFMYGILSNFAEFERNIIKERQLAGIAAAKERGQTWGAGKTYVSNEAEEWRLFQDYYHGRITREHALKIFGGTPQAFYYRYKKWRDSLGLENKKRKPGKPKKKRGLARKYDYAKKEFTDEPVVAPKMDVKKFMQDPNAEYGRFVSGQMNSDEEEN